MNNHLTHADKIIYQLREDISDLIENLEAGNTLEEMVSYVNEEWSDEYAE